MNIAAAPAREWHAPAWATMHNAEMAAAGLVIPCWYSPFCGWPRGASRSPRLRLPRSHRARACPSC